MKWKRAGARNGGASEPAEAKKHTPVVSEHHPDSILSVWSAGLCFSSTSLMALLSICVPPRLPLIWFAAPFVSHLASALHIQGSPSALETLPSWQTAPHTHTSMVMGPHQEASAVSPLIRPICRPLSSHIQWCVVWTPAESLPHITHQHCLFVYLFCWYSTSKFCSTISLTLEVNFCLGFIANLANAASLPGCPKAVLCV